VKASIAAFVGLLAISGVLGVAVAQGAGSPTGGTVRIFVVPAQAQGSGKVVLTGAIGDAGSSHKVNKSGAGVMTLHKGTIDFNLAQLMKKQNNPHTILANKTTCSFVAAFTAPVPITGGTGAYKGISGTLMITETFAAYGPLYTSGTKKGQCNQSQNAQPLGFYVSVQGIGPVKFS
jgi:hypothetical protein